MLRILSTVASWASAEARSSEQYLQFPFGAHDDLIDAISRIYDMDAEPPMAPTARQENVVVYSDGIWDPHSVETLVFTLIASVMGAMGVAPNRRLGGHHITMAVAIDLRPHALQ
jgi:hypothetical protein